MQKLMTAFDICIWIALLTLAIAGVARVSIEAKDRRNHHQIARLY
ncbi:hypothetical protein [Bradyrhizobium sp. UFLA05-112]